MTEVIKILVKQAKSIYIQAKLKIRNTNTNQQEVHYASTHK